MIRRTLLDEDFWKMFSGFLMILIVTVLTITILEKVTSGEDASIRINCLEEEG